MAEGRLPPLRVSFTPARRMAIRASMSSTWATLRLCGPTMRDPDNEEIPPSAPSPWRRFGPGSSLTVGTIKFRAARSGKHRLTRPQTVRHTSCPSSCDGRLGRAHGTQQALLAVTGQDSAGGPGREHARSNVRRSNARGPAPFLVARWIGIRRDRRHRGSRRSGPPPPRVAASEALQRGYL